ncbi:MAG: prepilin peptidase [Deltaproteobacteria bacterium]|nr:prepilin peptidase [Deltaproteobacteria bacterium]
MSETLALFSTPPRVLPWQLAAYSLGAAFVFGALWGSFLNVVIARVPLGQSVVTPRSRCPRCGTQIAVRDNVPVLSWLWLRAKCRHCGAPIPALYPFVELLGGLAGAAVVARFGWSLAALELFVFTLTLVAISFIDVKWFIVPDGLNVALAATGLGLGALRAWWLGPDAAGGLAWSDVTDRVIGGVGAGLVLSAVIVASTAVIRALQERRRRAALARRRLPVAARPKRRPSPRATALRLPPDEWAMGWGDPLIFAGIGLHVGWKLQPLVLFVASLVGAAVGIAVARSGGLKNRAPIVLPGDEPWTPPDHAVPFGPFLAIGGLVAAFFGESILQVALPALQLAVEAVLLPGLDA